MGGLSGSRNIERALKDAANVLEIGCVTGYIGKFLKRNDTNFNVRIR